MNTHAEGTASSVSTDTIEPTPTDEQFGNGAAPQPAAPTPTLSLQQILDATAACLNETGYDGTTIRKIAGRLNCAVGSIYRYCTDKRALLSAVTQQRFEPVVQAIDDHVSVARTAESYASIAAAEPQQYRLMFWLASLGGERDTHNAVPEVVQRILDGWTRQLGDPRAAQRLWSHLHGSIMLGQSAEEAVRDLNIDALLPGGEARAEAREEAPAGEAESHANGQPVSAGGAVRREDLTLL